MKCTAIFRFGGSPVGSDEFCAELKLVAVSLTLESSANKCTEALLTAIYELFVDVSNMHAVRPCRCQR